MQQHSWYTSDYWLLLQLSIRARHDFARLADRFGLTWAQLHTLCSLRPGESVPMNTISSLLACDASNVTGIADRLIIHGLVERREDSADRRIKMVTLTEKGVATREEAMKGLDKLVPAGFTQLSSEERQQMHRLLQKALRT